MCLSIFLFVMWNSVCEVTDKTWTLSLFILMHHIVKRLSKEARTYSASWEPGDNSSLEGYDITFVTCWRRPVIFIRGSEINKKSSSNLKNLGARRVTCRKFNIGNPQILGVTIQNLVRWVMPRPLFVQPSSSGHLYGVISQKTGIFKILLIFNLGIGPK